MNRRKMPSICAIAKRGAIAGLCAALLAPTIPVAAWAQPVGLPTMGAASAADLSPMLERSLGEAIMSQGRRDPTYVDDPELSQYLTTMGRKLAAFAPGAVPEVEMFGVRDPEINAFAMPGGFIGINTCLLYTSPSPRD